MGALTLMQWVQIASVIISAEPKIQAAFVALHPVFSQIVSIGGSAISAGISDAGAAHEAASSAMNWMAENGDGVIRDQERRDQDN